MSTGSLWPYKVMSTAPRDLGPPPCLWDTLSSLPHKGFWGSAVVFSLSPLFRRVIKITLLPNSQIFPLPLLFCFWASNTFLYLVIVLFFQVVKFPYVLFLWWRFLLFLLVPTTVIIANETFYHGCFNSPNIATVLVLASAKCLFSFNFCFPKFLVIWMIFR